MSTQGPHPVPLKEGWGELPELTGQLGEPPRLPGACSQHWGLSGTWGHRRAGSVVPGGHYLHVRHLLGHVRVVKVRVQVIFCYGKEEAVQVPWADGRSKAPHVGWLKLQKLYSLRAGEQRSQGHLSPRHPEGDMGHTCSLSMCRGPPFPPSSVHRWPPKPRAKMSLETLLGGHLSPRQTWTSPHSRVHWRHPEASIPSTTVPDAELRGRRAHVTANATCAEKNVTLSPGARD